MAASDKTRKAHRIALRLAREYDLTVPAGSRGCLVGQLVRTILSQKTTSAAAEAAFQRLLADGDGDWETIAARPARWIAARIRASGLADQKAPRIRAILNQVRRERGAVDLEHLRNLDNAAVRAELEALPGVGPKTADCVLLFGMGRAVLPVDTHLYRTTKRLGLLEEEVPLRRARDELEAVVAERDRGALHVGLFQHGRAVCRPGQPRCDACCLMDLCPEGQARLGFDKRG